MEIWKDIPGYHGKYQVSNEGRVRSLPQYNLRTTRILKPGKSKNGYYRVSLSSAAKRKSFLVHQLVAMAFLNHKPNGHSLVVDHINNISTDNRLENLQIITLRENTNKDRGERDLALPLGVYKTTNGKKYGAHIGHKGKVIYLGSYDTPEEAHEAYLTKLKELEDND